MADHKSLPDPNDAKVHDDPNADPGDKMKDASCTDLPCLVVFLAYLAGMVYVMSYAIGKGDPRRLTHGFNHMGMLCGVDPPVGNAPLLFWCQDEAVNGIPTSLNMNAPICVSKCPTTSDVELPCLAPSSTHSTVSGTPPYVTMTSIIESRTVPKMSYPTKELAGLYCIPDLDALQPGVAPESQNTTMVQDLVGPDGPLGGYTQHVLHAFGGLRRCWKALVGSLVLAIVLSYVYLFVLRTCAKIIVWSALAVSTLMTFGIAIYFFWGDLAGMGDVNAKLAWEGHNPIFQEYDSERAYTICRCVGLGFTLVGVATTTIILCFRQAIDTAVGCVVAACECVFSMPSLLLMPLIEAVSKLLQFMLLLYGFTWVLTMGEIERATLSFRGMNVGGVRRTFQYTDEEIGMMLFYVFGALWLMELLASMSQFALSYAVVKWYYTEKDSAGNKPMVKFPLTQAWFVGAFWHLGTLALGSFLIALLRFARILIGVLAKHTKADSNAVVKCIVTALLCCLHCFENFLKYVNKNAYIDVAISSTGYLTAAKHVFEFMANEAAASYLLNGACWMVTIAGVVSIGLATGLATLWTISTIPRWTDQTSSNYVADPEFAAFIAGAAGGFIACGFMMVFDHTADTLLYTYDWNKSHGHSTVPKFAPDSLAKLAKYQPRVKKTAATSSPDGGGGSSGGGFFSFFSPSKSAPSSSQEEKQALMHTH